MICPKCGQDMAIVSLIQPPQAEVIEKILKHCGLWKEPVSRAPPDIDSVVQALDLGFSGSHTGAPAPDHAQELTYEDIDTFLYTF